MATISSPGIGSGLDISGIVTKLMSIEQQPLAALQTKQTTLTAELSAYGTLKATVTSFQGAMDSLDDVSKFKIFTANSSVTTVATASADATAARGTYALEVKRIAENHRMVAGTVFADTTATTVGTAGDKMTIGVGGKNFTVDIGGKTLDQVRAAINAATDNTGVTASTLHDDAGYHLTLSANDTGSANLITTTYSAAADPFSLATINKDRDGNGSFTSADLDAQITVENTYTMTRSSNTVSDVIAGVTLNLASAGTTRIDVTRDTGQIGTSVQSLVSAYNSIMKAANQVSAGVLKTDRAAVSSMADRFHAILQSKAGTSSQFSRLAEIGITTAKDGTLTFDSKVFQSALAKDPDGVASMFTDPNTGVAVRFKALADNMLGVNGMFGARNDSLKSQIDGVGKQITTLNARLTLKQAALQKQYSALDALVAKLNSTNSYLTSQLATLTKSNSG